MPSQAIHQAKAERFLRLYEAIPKDHPEGRAIALFYCAMHLVEMVAASEGTHNHNHTVREKYIREKHSDMYRPLQEASEQARYLAGDFPMNAEQLEHQLRRKRLRAFELWSEAILRPKPVPPKAALPSA